MGEQLQVLADSVIMSDTPDAAAEASNELLFGEIVEVIEDAGEWARVRAAHDGYEGFVPRGAFDDEIVEATHVVSALRTFAFAETDFKSAPLRVLSYQSRLHIIVEDEGYGLLAQGGWVFMGHVRAIEARQDDIVANALPFIGAPYLWGGRTSLGLDCSALVQLSCMAAGIDVPRDTKDQVSAIGTEVKTPQRGDFVFFEGHVGIMVDEQNLLNATARHMQVLIEPLREVAAAYDGITAIKRL
ncbi:MAG: NlpC/P60 family protein [Alphaproteobacteria bacterium]